MSKSQRGLAPIIIVLGLLSLGVFGAGGYYWVANQKPAEMAQPAPQDPLPSPIVSVETVKMLNEESLLSMDGVEKVEVGEKDGKPCVVVFTFQETDELQNLENNGLDGYEVKVENSPKMN